MNILDLFISPAHAAAPGGGAAGIISMLPLIAMVVIFYFFLMRPQQKRAKEHRAMLEALKVGDEVMTTGGIGGKISELGDAFLAVEIADGVVIRAQKQSVASVLPKGTLNPKS